MSYHRLIDILVHAHLTTRHSEYVVARLPPDLFPKVMIQQSNFHKCLCESEQFSWTLTSSLKFNLSCIIAIQCENGLEYQPCIDVCAYRKCDEPHYNITACPSPCVEGCGCAERHLMKDGELVDAHMYEKCSLWIRLILKKFYKSYLYHVLFHNVLLDNHSISVTLQEFSFIYIYMQKVKRYVM